MIKFFIFTFVSFPFSFVSTYVKKRCSEASRFKVRNPLSFLNLEVSEIFSGIALLKTF